MAQQSHSRCVVQSKGFCDLVLTAAHCVLPGVTYKVVDYGEDKQPISVPVQKLPRDPTIVTTDQPMSPMLGTAPPTIAFAGAENRRRRAARKRGVRIICSAAI